MLIASAKKESRIPPLEPDTYPARCVGVYDIGEQYSEKYDKYSRQIVLSFELPFETIKIDDKDEPRYMSITTTMALGSKSRLRQILETWRGKAFTEAELNGFDLAALAGVPCLLSVVQKTSANGNTYSTIGGVSKLTKGMTVPDPFREPVVFDLDAPDMNEKIEQLPEWIQKQIKESKTYKDKQDANPNFMDIDPNDLPFNEG